jgi:hypothetical protein
VPVLRNAPDDPERLKAMLAQIGVTHVLVHEGAFLDDRGRRLSAWLRAQDAHEIATASGDRLFALK